MLLHLTTRPAPASAPQPQPAEQDVQDVQDRRKVGLVRHLFIRQVEAAFLEEADISFLRGARGMGFFPPPPPFLEWLLPLLGEVLVAGPLHHPPLLTSQNMTSTANSWVDQ